MAIAESMKGITENIIASHAVRIGALNDLVVDTRKTLEGFARERKRMSKEQAKNLSDFVEGLSKSVGDMLKAFQRDHKHMSGEQAKSLADFVKNMIKDVGLMLNGFQNERLLMSDELEGNLEKGEADRLKTFKDMMGNIRKDIKQVETYVANKLNEFSDARSDMSEELKKDLAKYVAGIVSAVKKLLGECSSDMKKAANAWQGMSKTLARARAGKAEVSAKVKVMPVEEAIEEVSEEEEVSPEVELAKKVLKFIEKHPKGVKVSDMEEPLGVARTSLGKIAKKLLEEGKVRKEENLYFPL